MQSKHSSQDRSEGSGLVEGYPGVGTHVFAHERDVSESMGSFGA